jgi:hypothetical protein
MSAFFLALAFLPSDASGLGDDGQMLPLWTLTSLKPEEAKEVSKERGILELVLDSPETEMADGSLAYECVSADGVSRCVWFRPSEEVPQAGKVIVQGFLRIIHHPPSIGSDGTLFEGFTEYRIMRARLVR